MDPFAPKPEHVQGSAEWLAHRQKHLGASDAAAAMGIDPWKTPYQLWEQKLGIAPPVQVNAAMQRGTDMEPEARKAFEAETGLEVFPQVVYHPQHAFMMASMDGLTLSKDFGCEIKCPGAKSHAIALDGKIPEHYMPQLQHQLACLDIPMLWYYSYDGTAGVAIEVPRDEEYISRLIDSEQKFWECVKSKTPPEMTNKDYVIQEGPKWSTISHYIRVADKRIKDLKGKISLLEDEKDAYKQELIVDAQGRSSRCGSLTLTRSFPKGRIEYGKIPQLEGVDLEPFRKEAKEQWTLRIGKDGTDDSLQEAPH